MSDRQTGIFGDKNIRIIVYAWRSAEIASSEVYGALERTDHAHSPVVVLFNGCRKRIVHRSRAAGMARPETRAAGDCIVDRHGGARRGSRVACRIIGLRIKGMTAIGHRRR